LGALVHFVFELGDGGEDDAEGGFGADEGDGEVVVVVTVLGLGLVSAGKRGCGVFRLFSLGLIAIAG
jgi:hypothetical protein